VAAYYLEAGRGTDWEYLANFRPSPNPLKVRYAGYHCKNNTTSEYTFCSLQLHGPVFAILDGYQNKETPRFTGLDFSVFEAVYILLASSVAALVQRDH